MNLYRRLLRSILYRDGNWTAWAFELSQDLGIESALGHIRRKEVRSTAELIKAKKKENKSWFELGIRCCNFVKWENFLGLLLLPPTLFLGRKSSQKHTKLFHCYNKSFSLAGWQLRIRREIYNNKSLLDFRPFSQLSCPQSVCEWCSVCVCW